MKLTLSQVKASTLPAAVNMPSCDARFIALVNEAQQRLVMRSNSWYDMHYKYQISINNGVVTWPREIASVSAIAQCTTPIPLRNMWFEFIESGYGLRGSCSDQDASTCCIQESLDRGTSPIQTDLSGSYKLKVYCDLASDAGTVVIVKGYDSNGNWIRTLDGASYIDGEKISTATTGTTSSSTFSSISSVIKPETDGPVRIYEFHSSDSSQSVLAVYQWNETVPIYRRSWIGNVCDVTTTSTITVIAKREFIPVSNDNDILMIGNLPALKAMCLAILQEDKNDLASAAVNEQRAIRIMDDEAKHYLGDGMKVPVRVEGKTWGAGELGIGWRF